MQDVQLQIATNARPAITPGAGITRWLFPSLVAPDYIDLLAARDFGRGATVYANFRVSTAFNVVASNFIRPAVFVDSVPTFLNILTNNELVIARGPDVLSGGLGTIGVGFSIPVPQLSDLVLLTGQGRRFITLGIEASVPTTDWSAGGLDAWFEMAPYGKAVAYPGY